MSDSRRAFAEETKLEYDRRNHSDREGPRFLDALQAKIGDPGEVRALESIENAISHLSNQAWENAGSLQGIADRVFGHEPILGSGSEGPSDKPSAAITRIMLGLAGLEQAMNQQRHEIERLRSLA